MTFYTVQHRPNNNGSLNTRDVRDPDVILIKEGFCWPALYIPLLWLLYQKQFWGFLAYILLTAVLSAAAAVTSMDPLTGLLLYMVLSLLVASVANEWRRWRLSAKGYEIVTVIMAVNLRQAEEIFFRREWQSSATPHASIRNIAISPPVTPLPASRLTPFASPLDPV